MRLPLIAVTLALLTSAALARPHEFPYRSVGLTPQQASAHLLNRLAFGPRPGQVEAVAAQGLENWVESQLRANLPSPEMDRRLGPIPEESNERRLNQRKLIRAVYNENQLLEVMSDFWFNHFNVSLTDGDCREFVAAYEREAIRPHALGSFRALLGATAQHPAMLYYLDNAYSVSEQGRSEAVGDDGMDAFRYNRREGREAARKTTPSLSGQPGLNENYARELLELHTMGVDGGYRQSDVREVARAFTGWTVERNQNAGKFIFRSQSHDNRPKRILYTLIPAGEQNEGEKVLDLLASHTATAKFLAHKFAVRFASDSPPAGLEDRLRKAFLRYRGDTRELVWALLESPEFWSSSVVRSKVKTPFELIASALRITSAKLDADPSVINQLAQMGQDCYSCRPPTGWPDRASYWISPGNMLNRMAFALELAASHYGVTLQPRELLTGKAPTTPDKALAALAVAVLPGRDTRASETLLLQAVLDPNYAEKVLEAQRKKGRLPKPGKNLPKAAYTVSDQQLVNTLGLLLGSPEFQRR